MDPDIKNSVIIGILCNDLANVIYTSFSIGESITKKDLKNKLQEVYTANNITKTAKAVDILNYFNVREFKQTDPITKKRAPCYQLLSVKTS